MIGLVNYETDHLFKIDMLDGVRMHHPVSIYRQYSYEAFTVVKDSAPVAAFGAIPMDAHMELWMLTGRGCSAGCLLHIGRFTEQWFPQLPTCLLVALVNDEFEQGHRWMGMLDFERQEESGLPGLTEYQRQIAWAA